MSGSRSDPIRESPEYQQLQREFVVTDEPELKSQLYTGAEPLHYGSTTSSA
ncbi:hypothetical protein [Rhodococcus sovatensis]|uniref:Uncharacterized protein n=1 Tax=Rhodococcus sovatensis TaxID=1805840 RepID=A0ABZ2PKL2_9NOCA